MCVVLLFIQPFWGGAAIATAANVCITRGLRFARPLNWFLGYLRHWRLDERDCQHQESWHPKHRCAGMGRVRILMQKEMCTKLKITCKM